MKTTPSSKGYQDLIALYDATLERLTIPHQTQFVNSSYGNTHLISAGPEDAEAVLILHGAASNAAGCWPLINGLASKYRVYAPDAPRQLGKTEPFRLSARNADYGKWLTEVLDGLNTEHTKVVGFSFGGWMACKLASHAPQRIDELVLLSPVGVVPFRLQYWMQAPALLWMMMIFQTDRSIRKFANLLAGPTAPKEMIEELVAAAKIFLKNFYNQDVPFRFSKRVLNKITAPTLLLVGGHDTFCKPEMVVSRIQENVPNVQTELFADMGHVIYFEKPALINVRILEFFESNSLKKSVEK